MEKLKQQIAQKLKQIEKMIEIGEEKNKIEVQRKELDKLLNEYLKDIRN